MSKYSLKNEYQNLLKEEIVSIIRSGNYDEKIYNVDFDDNGEIISGKKFEPTEEFGQRTYKKIFDESLIAQQFTTESRLKIISFLQKLMKPDARGSYKGYSILQPCPTNPEEIIKRLNDHFRETIDWKPSNKIGRGEVSIRLAFSSKIRNLKEGEDASVYREPDFIGWNKNNQEIIKLSVKSFVNIKKSGADQAGTVRTGTNLDPEIVSLLEKLSNDVFDESEYTTVWNPKNKAITDKKTAINNKAFREIVNHYLKNNTIDEKLEKLKKIKEAINNIKSKIITEHNAEGIVAIKKDKTFSFIKPEEINRISIYTFNGKRFFFYMPEDDSEKGRSSWDLEIDIMIKNQQEKIQSEQQEMLRQEDSYYDGFVESHDSKGKVLKEVYSHLFKKKLVKEGGLGGHMRHPYENLDVTPREMMDRIESYGVPQTVIDKVDGQNLFFTVERDGTLLFARNKQDMTHQDLVDKFTGHGAEAAFLEGGEAIKRGVEQWLGSAGNFADQEVLDIFHPTEDIRSFINFEIMHPKNSNQIQYDKKYIVFHSIVDFGEGRSKIFSSNQDDRLKKLISLMNAGVSSTGFELASNREIDLNTLSNVQIMSYTNRVKELIEALDMKEDEFLADGILRIIDEELSQEGVNLEENTLKIMRDFVLYGEDGAGDAITSRDFTKHISKEDTKTLRALGLTSATKAKAKVAKILSPFKEIFVDLGIDLLKGVDSAYLSPEQSKENITSLRDKLQTAIEDYDQYIMSTPEDELSKIALRLKPHVDKIKQVGIDKAVSTSVEGGVYTQDLDLEKITGGFAPLNQIVGAAYRDKEGIFPNFQDKFLKESKSYSLKSVFKL